MKLPLDVLELIFSYLSYDEITEIMIPFDEYFWEKYVLNNYFVYQPTKLGYTWKQLAEKLSRRYRFIETALYSPIHRNFFYYEELLLRDNDIFFHDYGEDMALLVNNDNVIIGAVGYKKTYEDIMIFFDSYVDLLPLNPKFIKQGLKKFARLEHFREKSKKELIGRFTERKLAYAGPFTSKQVNRIFRMPKLESMINDPLFDPLMRYVSRYLLSAITDPMEYLFEDKLNELYSKLMYYTMCLLAKTRSGYDFLMEDGTLAQPKYDVNTKVYLFD